MCEWRQNKAWNLKYRRDCGIYYILFYQTLATLNWLNIIARGGIEIRKIWTLRVRICTVKVKNKRLFKSVDEQGDKLSLNFRRQLCTLYNICWEIVPFLCGSVEGLLSVAGDAVQCLDGVGCCVKCRLDRRRSELLMVTWLPTSLLSRVIIVSYREGIFYGGSDEWHVRKFFCWEWCSVEVPKYKV